MDTKTINAFQGMLTADSPLREVFPNGVIPITSPFAQKALLGPSWTEQNVYFVDPKACTPEQCEGMARLMSRMGQGTLEECRAAVAAGDHLPVRDRNFSGVSFPLRYAL